MIQQASITSEPSTWANSLVSTSKDPKNLILCIDDEIRSLEIRKLLLQKAGYHVLTCRNGKEGIAAFGSMPVRLVMLDYAMPGMNGAEVAKVMRRTKPDVPILMLSGYPDPPDDIGDAVDLYVVKGGDPRNLLDHIHRLLGEQPESNVQLWRPIRKQIADGHKFLNSWKEVAQYLGRAVRTVQRWEKESGLPVRRLSGKVKSPIIAVATEIDEWIKTAADARSMPLYQGRRPVRTCSDAHPL